VEAHVNECGALPRRHGTSRFALLMSDCGKKDFGVVVNEIDEEHWGRNDISECSYTCPSTHACRVSILDRILVLRLGSNDCYTRKGLRRRV
jgi:hypothetical protein